MIHNLRTYKSHPLDIAKKHDKQIIMEVERWYFDIAGQRKPSQGQIILCSNELNRMAFGILTSMEDCLQRILHDSRKGKLVDEMQIISITYLPDYMIEECFNNVVGRLQISLNAYTLTKKFGARIREKIRNYPVLNKVEYNNLLILCIEEILVAEKLGICPLSGDRIKAEYQMNSGRLIGKLKSKAIEIFEEDIFISENDLLKKLKEVYPPESVTEF